MKLYVKANSLKILKNLDTLLYHAVSKSELLVGRDAPAEYRVNLQSAKTLHARRKELFYDDRPLERLIKGVYFGNSSCEHLLPGFRELSEAVAFCRERHYNFILSLPPLSEFSMAYAKELVTFCGEEGFAVVVNDFGSLGLALAQQGVTPILGPAFTKQMKNAFIDHVTPTELSPEQRMGQKRLLEHIAFEDADTRAFYKNMGVGRFSLENLPADLAFLNDKPKMQADLYYPYLTLADSKACDIAGLYSDEQNYFAAEQCTQPCRGTALEFAHGEIFGLHQRYNTLYRPQTALLADERLIKDDKNRLVWELFL